MKAFELIVEKLLLFSRKYYTRLLIRGLLLFISLGALFFLCTLAVEYFLWLNSTGRLILFLLFIGAETYLLIRFMLVPLAYLFRIRKGISEKEASLIIGKHFPQVGDKLINLLELAEDSNRSELLLASIEQRSTELKPVPFQQAINLKDGLRYAKYATIPLIIIGIIWISGNLKSFFGSYDRVVNYDLAYEPPAPFNFIVLTGDLNVLETEEVRVQVSTEGSIQPDEIQIVIDGKPFLMQQSDGFFQYQFRPPLKSSEFYFTANGFNTRDYRLTVYQVPSIEDFVVRLMYPSYTEKSSEVLNSTGNATVPEGTEVRWEIQSSNTDKITLITADSSEIFEKNDQQFNLNKTIFKNFNYQIATSNKHAESYEKLNYRFKVIRDNQPTITAREFVDSLNPNVRYYEGESADDYRVVSLKLVYYPSGREQESREIILEEPNTNFKQFYYTFPSGLDLSKGQDYDFYFQATDNDRLRGGKSARTQIFSTRIYSDNELIDKKLDNQKNLLEDLDRSLDTYKKQEEALKEINQEQKEKNQLNYTDQNRVRDFLEKQEQQEEMMQRFSRQLKENLEKEEQDNRLKELLEERLARQEMEARKNQKLLEELKKIADKLEKEELGKKLEELAKNQRKNERNLEQLLELTKRYYVTEKAAQLARELEELSERQKELADKQVDSLTAKKQEEKNKAFDKLAQELEDLEKDNQNLKKPLGLKIDKELKKEIKQDQDDALEQLKDRGKSETDGEKSDKQENSDNKAKSSQRSAGEKMKQMSQDLQESSSMSGSGSTIVEDAEMLRQILDNLVTFSFKQETLFDRLEGQDYDISNFSEVVKDQNELQDLFSHIDDSLFALSLRRVELSEFVNEQINEAFYNMDKAVESIVEGRIYQGVSYQQYVLTAANSLADFLANILDNMQQSMQAGSGQGSGEDFQLPDIIRGQQELGQQMGQSQGKGQKGQQGEQNEGEQGNSSDGNDKGQEQGDTQGNEQGNKRGKGGDNQMNEGQGTGGQDGEENMAEIYEIYKQQQQIRQMLEKQLEDMIRNEDRQLAKRLIQQMEAFENDLLNNGITERTINRANNIQHQLLRLENAAMEQGKKEERKSESNEEIFSNPVTTKPQALEELRNDIEILNRQALPLHQIFQEKVKDYFNARD